MNTASQIYTMQCDSTAERVSIDEKFMGRAIMLARHGWGFVSPNPMVGAVIVNSSGLIVGEGWHRRYGGPHAEVNAVESARRRGVDFSDCTIYVTLEPCAHYGKTPPCALLLRECGFRRVVIGCVDPFPKVSGRGIDILRDAGIEVVCGVLEKECLELNRRFFFAHRNHRPWVMLKWAQSADGFMGHTERREYYSTPLTTMLMHRERAGVDAILAGTGTLLADDPSLTLRFWPGNPPRPLVLSSPRLTPELKVLKNNNTILVPHAANLRQMLDSLYADYGITSLMVEGGARLLRSFLDEGELWQEARVEIAPRIQSDGIKAPALPAGEINLFCSDGNSILTIGNPLSVNER